MTTTHDVLPRVSPDGRDLILVARALVRGGPYEEIEGILVGESRMRGVGAGTMRLLEETLARGGVHALARLGGWRRRARPTADGVMVGRLWEVGHTPPLAFSAYAYELCQWLVAQPLGSDGGEGLRATPNLPGDELLAYLACALVEGQPLERRVAQQPGVRASALAWLGFPGMLGAVEGRASHRAPFDALVRRGAVVLEALGDDLARRAVAYERAKAELTSTLAVSRLGDARDRALGFLLDALEQAGRWDLATFLVDAATTLLPRALSGAAAAAQLVNTLDGRTTLGDRATALRASAAHLRHVGRLARQHEVLRQARHFDEGYARAQMLLSRWEPLGSEGFARAADALAHFDALDRG